MKLSQKLMYVLSLTTLLVASGVNAGTVFSSAFGGADNDSANQIAVTSDGVAVLGTTESEGAGCSDIWLVKTDVNGAVQWTKNYGTTSCEEMCTIYNPNG